MSEIRNVVIIGSGCAGHTAALYTARANFKPLVVEGHEPGGQLSLTTLVENFPGFPEGIMGPQLVENMRKQAERFGAEYRIAHLTSADLSQRPFLLHLGKHQVHAQSLIIATGASARWLGLPNEQKLIGHGVSSCATCDGFFFSGKEIVVVGGGDSAMEEAMFLAKFAGKVGIVHRRPEFRASKIMLERARAIPNIEWLTPYVVEELHRGENGSLGRARLRNTEDGSERELPISGAFIAIGHEPQSQIVQGQVDTDPNGYVVTEGKTTLTNLPGVFAAGDLVDHTYRQAVTAAGSGCQAALDAEWYLRDSGPLADATPEAEIVEA